MFLSPNTVANIAKIYRRWRILGAREIKQPTIFLLQGGVAEHGILKPLDIIIRFCDNVKGKCDVK